MISLYRRSDEQAGEGDDRETESFNKILVDERLTWFKMFQTGIDEGTYVGIVVLSQDVEIALIDRRLDAVELADVCVLDPIHQHFTTKNKQEWRQNFAGPAGQYCKTVGKYGIVSDWGIEICCTAIGAKHAESSNLNDVS